MEREQKGTGKHDRLWRWAGVLFGLAMLVMGVGCQVMIWSAYLFSAFEERWEKAGLFDPVRPLMYWVGTVMFEAIDWISWFMYASFFLDSIGAPHFQFALGATFLWFHLAFLGWLCARTVERPSRVACVGWGMLSGACVAVGLAISFLVAQLNWWWFNEAPDKIMLFAMLASTMVGFYFACRKNLTGRGLMWMQLVFFAVVEVLILFIIIKGSSLRLMLVVPASATYMLGQFLALYMLLNGIALAASYRRHVRREREIADQPTCVACGYDLRGAAENRAGVCPECGKSFGSQAVI